MSRLKNTEYAIVDIETTGGYAHGSRITEIAIIIHDGSKIIDRYETLVNPQKEIPLPIFALTGINNELVKDAPIFDDISDKICEMLSGRIFVAHNVNFDYSFIRHELESSGLKWAARKLCTVRAARKICPGLVSYSLGRLCNSLDIPLNNRHRAGGDADATTILFTKLLEWDEEGILSKMIKNTAADQRLPPNLPSEDFQKLPEKPGVYYFYNQSNKVIYVGKAVNIKKRVASHFSGNSTTKQRQNFLRDIYSISFEECANEFMALMLECIEIKNLWPTYNRALKRFEPKFALYHYEARNGYKYLTIGKQINTQSSIQTFNNEYDGINLLRTLAEKFEIDYRFCKFTRGEDDEVPYHHVEEELPEVTASNMQIDKALDFIMNNNTSYAIIDNGRSLEERSCIWVENGHFYGMGYLPVDIGFNDPQEIKNYVTPYRSNHYLMQLINSYITKYPRKVFFNGEL